MATLRARKPYTCRALLPGGVVCAAYLTDADGDQCPPHALQAVAGLKPLPQEPRDESAYGVTPKPHWPFWPGAEAQSIDDAVRGL